VGERRTLEIGQKTLPEADCPQAPGCRGAASRRGNGSGGRQGSRHQRGYVPPLDESVRWDELQRGQTTQGARKGECPPEKAARRAGSGYRYPKGGESGKLLSQAQRREIILRYRRSHVSSRTNGQSVTAGQSPQRRDQHPLGPGRRAREEACREPAATYPITRTTAKVSDLSCGDACRRVVSLAPACPLRPPRLAARTSHGRTS
jgi:hypothetical protein